MRKLLYLAEFWLMKGLYRLLSILPFSWITVLAHGIGRLFPFVPACQRVHNNLRITGFDTGMPKQQFLREVGTQCTHLFLDYALIKRYARAPQRWQMRDTESSQRLDTLRNAGTGAVFVTAHLGNWEMIRFAARARGVEIGMIYRPFNNPYVDNYAYELASEAGQPVFRKGARGMREMIKHIRAGRSVLILVDQRSGGSPQLNFMGQPAETGLAAADLALKFRCPLVPCYAHRKKQMTEFHITIETPVENTTPVQMMQSINHRIEAWIQEHPEQWFWVHNRWKTRPTLEHVTKK